MKFSTLKLRSLSLRNDCESGPGALENVFTLVILLLKCISSVSVIFFYSQTFSSTYMLHVVK